LYAFVHYKHSSYDTDARLLDKIRHTVDDSGRRPHLKGNSTVLVKRQATNKYKGPGAPPMLPPNVKAVIVRTFKLMAKEGQPLDALGWAGIAADIVKDMGEGHLLFDPDDPEGAGKFKLGYACEACTSCRGMIDTEVEYDMVGSVSGQAGCLYIDT
jgi:hypothetical protein